MLIPNKIHNYLLDHEPTHSPSPSLQVQVIYVSIRLPSRPRCSTHYSHPASRKFHVYNTSPLSTYLSSHHYTTVRMRNKHADVGLNSDEIIWHYDMQRSSRSLPNNESAAAGLCQTTWEKLEQIIQVVLNVIMIKCRNFSLTTESL